MKEIDLQGTLKDITGTAKRHRIPLTHLCLESSISRSTLLRWTTGFQSPTVDNLNQMIRTLNKMIARTATN